MTDKKNNPGELIIREEPLDPLDVLVPELPTDDQRLTDTQRERPQMSFEVAWRLGH